MQKHVGYNKDLEMFKAGATTYSAPELAGVLEATVDNLDDVKKSVRAKHAEFTAYVKDKTLQKPERSSPLSSSTRFSGQQGRPHITGHDPFGFSNEPEETPQTRFYTGSKRKKRTTAK